MSSRTSDPTSTGPDAGRGSALPAPRTRRPLRCGVGQAFPVTTEDGKQLRLTRYRGGDRGPVVLTHGLGVSSLIFSIDTIATNLLE